MLQARLQPLTPCRLDDASEGLLKAGIVWAERLTAVAVAGPKRDLLKLRSMTIISLIAVMPSPKMEMCPRRSLDAVLFGGTLGSDARTGKGKPIKIHPYTKSIVYSSAL